MSIEKMHEVLDQIKKVEEQYIRALKLFSTANIEIPVPQITLPNLDFSPNLALPEIKLPIFEIPDFEFPNIHIPEIDFERIKKNTKDNSKHGWTLTGEIGIGDYLNDDLLGATQKEKDEYFLHYYSTNNWENFNHTKAAILEDIEPKWHDLIQECFECFENDKYKLVIPTLFTIIEGEMSFVFKSHLGSGNLIQMMEKKAKNEESIYEQISLYSIVHSMRNRLFGSLDFAGERNELINRHRTLHGRDDPKHWQKVDALRLFNVISSLQFIKDILTEKE